MGRVVLVAGCWFAFWMGVGSLAGFMFAGDNGGASNGAWFGFINGAYFAALTAFAWPFITPRKLDDWMDRRSELTDLKHDSGNSGSRA